MSTKDIVDSYRGRIKDGKVFFAPDFPDKRLRNALKAYAPGVEAYEVLLLVDNTVFGGCKDGFLVTERAIYAHDMWDSPNQIPISSIRSVQWSLSMASGKFAFNDGTSFCSLNIPERKNIGLLIDMMRDLATTNQGASSSTPMIAASGPWSCKACGARNDAGAGSCDCCDSPRR